MQVRLFRMKFDRWQSAGYLANHMARLFAQGLQARIGPLGLLPGTFPALLLLWEEDGLTQKELVARLGIEQATMANTLARMERDGLVRRKPHPVDGRAQQVWLTRKARALQESATAAAKAQNSVALSRLTEQERDAFIGLMRRIIETMQSEQS